MKKLVFLFLSLAATFSLFAQVTTSGIGGRVADDREQPMVGAVVVATHTPSGTVYRTAVDKKGNFRIQNMRVGGPYTVEIKMPGYKTASNEGITLRLGEEYRFNNVLSEGKSDEKVVVPVAANPFMHTSNKGPQTHISARDIANLPGIEPFSIMDYTKLVPQAGLDGSFLGQNPRNNNVTIDGAVFSQRSGRFNSSLITGGGVAQPLSLDAIEEMVITVAPFDVRQSLFNGASISAVTKSGTNRYEATGYAYLRFPQFEGDKVEGQTIPEAGTSNNYTYGASVGGPIIKNKLFFFVNGEFETSNYPGNTWWPSINGNTDAVNHVSRTTVYEMQTMKDFLMSTDDKNWSYNPGNYKYGNNMYRDNFKAFAKIDWNINDKNKLSVHYSEMHSEQDQLVADIDSPGGFLNYGRNSINSLSFTGSNYTVKSVVRSATAEWNAMFGPKVSNKLLGTYSMTKDERTLWGDPFPFVDIYTEEDNTNYMSFGTDPYSYNNMLQVHTASLTDNVSISLGNHLLTAGASLELNRYTAGFQNGGTSYYRFASMDDFMNNAKGLPGYAPTMVAYQNGFVGDTKPRQTLDYGVISEYVQDEWQLRKNLNLSLGVRIDIPLYLTAQTTPTQFVNSSGLNQNLSSVGFYNGETVDLGEWPIAEPSISPRFGINWDVFNNKSWVLRGGSGLFSGSVPMIWLASQPFSSGYVQNPLTVITDEATLEGMTFSLDYLNRGQGITTEQKGVLGTNSSVVKISDNIKTPQVWRTTVGTDIKLPWDLTLTLEGVFSKNFNALYYRNINMNQDVNIFQGFDNRPYWTGSTKVDSQFGEVLVLDNSNKGGSAALTAQLTKSFSHGFAGMVSYTYTAARDINSAISSDPYATWNSGLTYNMMNNTEIGNAAYAMPHKINAFLSYTIDYAKHFSTTIAVYYQGMNSGRVSYTYGNDLNGDGFVNDLLYVPMMPGDIRFVDKGTEGDPGYYSASDQERDFFNYVNGDSFLSKRKGAYTERNGGLRNWVNRFDVRILQDLYSNFGSQNRYKLQLSVDLINIGNMINSDWGVFKSCALEGNNNNINLLNAVLNSDGTPKMYYAETGELDGDGNPLYYTSGSPQFQVNADGTEDFKNKTRQVARKTLGNTWKCQVGLRFIF